MTTTCISSNDFSDDASMLMMFKEPDDIGELLEQDILSFSEESPEEANKDLSSPPDSSWTENISDSIYTPSLSSQYFHPHNYIILNENKETEKSLNSQSVLRDVEYDFSKGVFTAFDEDPTLTILTNERPLSLIESSRNSFISSPVRRPINSFINQDTFKEIEAWTSKIIMEEESLINQIRTENPSVKNEEISSSSVSSPAESSSDNDEDDDEIEVDEEDSDEIEVDDEEDSDETEVDDEDSDDDEDIEVDDDEIEVDEEDSDDDEVDDDDDEVEEEQEEEEEVGPSQGGKWKPVYPSSPVNNSPTAIAKKKCRRNLFHSPPVPSKSHSKGSRFSQQSYSINKKRNQRRSNQLLKTKMSKLLRENASLKRNGVLIAERANKVECQLTSLLSVLEKNNLQHILNIPAPNDS